MGAQTDQVALTSVAERRAEVEEALKELNPEALFLDGFEECLVGYATQFTSLALAVYDYDDMLVKLVMDGMTGEEAVEHMSFNIEGAWSGPNTPLILHRPEREAVDWAEHAKRP